MHPMLNVAVPAARAAGKVILRHMNRLESLSIRSKQRNDFVSEVDHMAEHEIVQRLRRAYPDHAILAEESGQHGQRGASQYLWMIDPLDGTTNFLHGVPQFAVSIALQRGDTLELGVVYDPFKEELFCAHRGDGATLNDRRIRVSEAQGLSGALLGTGIPYRSEQALAAYLPSLRALIKDTAGVRRAGAAALDLAYVACGRYDGFWELGLRPWDMAAGVVLVREAGGRVGDLCGGDDFMSSGNVAAGTPKVFEAMVRTLQSAMPECHEQDS